MNDLKSIYENYLVSLKIPAPWFVIKNNLIDIHRIDLENYNSDEIFILKEIFFKYDVFNSRYYHQNSPYELNIRVYYYLANTIDLKGRYELSCALFKNKNELFISEKNFISLAELILHLNQLHLNITYEIDEIIKEKTYNKIAKFML